MFLPALCHPFPFCSRAAFEYMHGCMPKLYCELVFSKLITLNVYFFPGTIPEMAK